MSQHSLSIEREQYRSNGYVLLKDLFPNAVMLAFYQRLQSDLDLTRSSVFLTQTNLLSKRSIEIYSYQYPPLATFLWGLTPTVTGIAGCELLPTYAYFRVYQQGDICRVHSDRHACEHSVSLSVLLSENHSWALSIERKRLEEPSPAVEADFGSEESTALPMTAGDAVMYQGIHHRHGRLEPNPNRWSAHLFLHWVDAHGPYADHAFDRVTLERVGAKLP